MQDSTSKMMSPLSSRGVGDDYIRETGSKKMTLLPDKPGRKDLLPKEAGVRETR